MVFRATLSLDGKEFDVLDCSYKPERKLISRDVYRQTFMTGKRGYG